MSSEVQGALQQFQIEDKTLCFLQRRSYKNGVTFGLTDTASDNICGTLEPHGDRVKPGLVWVDMQYILEPTYGELQFLMPYLGFYEPTPASDVWHIVDGAANQQSEFTIKHDWDQHVETYTGVKVDQAIFQSAKSDRPMRLILNMRGKTAAIAGSIDGTAITTNEFVFIHSESTVTLDALEVKPDEIALIIDHGLEVQHNNSLTPTRIAPTRHIVQYSTSNAWGANAETIVAKAMGQTVTNSGGSLKYADTGQVLQLLFEMPDIKQVFREPEILGKTEVLMPFNFRSYRTNSEPMLKATFSAIP